jgi:hypothetical protein
MGDRSQAKVGAPTGRGRPPGKDANLHRSRYDRPAPPKPPMPVTKTVWREFPMKRIGRAVAICLLSLGVAVGLPALVHQASAAPVTWIFYATGCLNSFGSSSCVGPMQYPQPVALGTLTSDGGPGVSHYDRFGSITGGSVLTGSMTFDLEFPLFHADGINQQLVGGIASVIICIPLAMC